MEIGHAGEKDGVTFVAGLRRRTRFDSADAAGVHRQPHVALPSTGQESLFRKDHCHWPVPSRLQITQYACLRP